MAAKKPHILLLIDDEHRPDFLPVEGNPVVRTPTLDRFIEGGFYFRNAYTPSPICVPGRQSFLTGLYPRNCGCTDFGDPLPPGSQTIPSHLAKYGYRAVAAGKMHFVGYDQLQGWHERIGRDIAVRHTYTPVDDSPRQAAVQRRPGTGKWTQIKEVANARAGMGQWMRHDLYSVEGALQFLEEYFANPSYDRPGWQPLLMAVSLWCPHYPYQCPEELFNYYLRRVAPFVEDLPEKFDCHDYFKVKIGRDVTYREAHRATAAYYGMIEWLDGQFGRVVRLLEHLNVLQDFAVVFLSDHGEMLGQKGLWEKQHFFDPSVRVPCFICWPQRFPDAGAIVRDNISLVDLFPTICDIANVPTPDGLDGRSVLPLMEGNAADWPDEVYSELYHRHNGPAFMVKQKTMKYVRFAGRDWPEQLFDLAADPGETRNLVGDPAYVEELVRLRAKLDALDLSPEGGTGT